MPILVALLCLVACGARDQNQPTPEPSATPTVMIPDIVIETPTPTPTPTTDPYCGIRKNWLEDRLEGYEIIYTVNLRSSVKEDWSTDPQATGTRGELNSVEERILSGELVRLERGIELDLDGNGRRERIVFDENQKTVNSPLKIGFMDYLTTEYDCLFTGNIYGVCLDEGKRITLLIEQTNTFEGSYSDRSFLYTVFHYYQVDGIYGYNIERYFWSEEMPIQPETWDAMYDGETITCGEDIFLLDIWEEDGEQYPVRFHFRQGMQPVGQFATVQTDVFSYDIVTKSLDAYIPAGNKVYVIAQNDEWLYVADCKYTAEAYVKISDDSGETIVHAPQKVTLEEALVYEEE